MEDGGLQGRLGSQEVDRCDGRSGGLNDSRVRRRFQTSKGECEEGLHQWTKLGRGCPERMDLDSTPGHNARSWWIALETTNELKNCLKGLDCGVSRKRRNWATQQRAGVAEPAGMNLGKLAAGVFLRCYEILEQKTRRGSRCTSQPGSGRRLFGPTKREEYHYVSEVMGMAYNSFLDSEAGNAGMNFEVVELLNFWKKKEPGSCLDLAGGGGEHSCDGRSCVRIQSLQWLGDITEKEKSEVQIMAECYASTTVNVATALGFFSRMSSLRSLEMLESEHHLVTAFSVESLPGVLQMIQKHIRGWKIGLEAEMGFPVSEAYNLPSNAKSLMGLVIANLCRSHYPLHIAMMEASSQRVIIDNAFLVPKCVRLARMLHHSYKLLRKILGAVPGDQSLEKENTNDSERQKTIEKTIISAPAMEENDVPH